MAPDSDRSTRARARWGAGYWAVSLAALVMRSSPTRMSLLASMSPSV